MTVIDETGDQIKTVVGIVMEMVETDQAIVKEALYVQTDQMTETKW